MKIFLKNRKGFVMLVTTVVFMMVSFIIIFGLTTPIIKQVAINRDIWSAKQSYYLSESGVEDVLFRLKDSSFNSHISSEETLAIDGYLTTTQVIDTASGKKIISLSDYSGYKKTIKTEVSYGSGISFNYGIFTGKGGFFMTGGSRIIGNIYSNGPIRGDPGTSITGSAISASTSVGFSIDQSNETLTSDYINFNYLKEKRDFSQSFKISTTSPIVKIRFYIKKTGNPNNFSVALRNNNSGVPGATVIANATLNSVDVTTSYSWTDINFTTNPTLTKDTTYWLVITGNNGWGTSTDYYTIAGNSNYVNGQAKTGVQGSTWYDTSPSGLDGLFAVLTGYVSGDITCSGTSGCMTIGSSSTDIVWASKVSNVSTPGIIYADLSSGNNKKAIEREDPPIASTPVVQADIDAWKTEALVGGTYNGNMHIDWTGGVIGPRKIVGDLTIDGGGTLLVTGTLWITGKLIMTAGGKIKISPSLGGNSAVILTDKYAQVDGNSSFEGSGVAGSYPILASTSVCPNTTPCAINNSAISLSGGAGAVVLAAPFGKVNIVGGAGARSVTGESIYISGGGVVTYETGLANMYFTSGPSGGWDISGWGEQ